MNPLNNANVQLDFMDLTVLLVHYQEDGTIKLTLVIALHQWQFGTHKHLNVNVQRDFMDHNVKLVHHQEHGILIKTNVFVLHQNLFGTEINVFVEKICMEIIA